MDFPIKIISHSWIDLKEIVSSLFNDQQRRVLTVGLIALGCLIAIYCLHRGWLKLKKIHASNDHKRLNSTPLKEHAEIYHESEDLEEAKIKFEKILKDNPNDIITLIYLGKILDQQNKKKEAQEKFKEAIKIDPNNYLVLCHYGDFFKKNKMLEQAVDLYAKAFALKPNDFFVLNGYGEILRVLGKLKPAKGHLKEALKIKPDDHFTLGIYADVLKQLGRFEKAEECYQRIFKKEIKSIFYFIGYGDILFRRKKFKEASKIYQQCLVIYPMNQEVRQLLIDTLKMIPEKKDEVYLQEMMLERIKNKEPKSD